MVDKRRMCPVCGRKVRIVEAGGERPWFADHRSKAAGRKCPMSFQSVPAKPQAKGPTS